MLLQLGVKIVLDKADLLKIVMNLGIVVELYNFLDVNLGGTLICDVSVDKIEYF